MFWIIILFVLLGYVNANRAKRKGKNPILWGLFTIIAFFICMVIGEFIVLGLFYKGQLNQQGVQSFFMSNELSIIFCLLSGAGGILFIRYLLDRTADINKDNPL